MRRLALLLLLLAAPASAQAPTTRVERPITAPSPLLPPAPLPGRGQRSPVDGDGLLPSTLLRAPLRATPRLARSFDSAAPACRSDCAAQYYACLAAEEQGACSAKWSQCLRPCSTLVTSR